MNIISKLGTTHFNQTSKNPDPRDGANKDTTDTGPKGQKERLGPSFPPSPNSAALGGQSAEDSRATTMPGFTEAKLKRQSLEALVAVLRSLVIWGTGVGSGGLASTFTPGSRNSQAGAGSEGDGLGSSRMSVEDSRGEDYDAQPSGSLQHLTSGKASSNTDLGDDPNKFETAKQRKTALLEGIRKFNFKPKRVRRLSMLNRVETDLKRCVTGHQISNRDWVCPKSRSSRYRDLPARDGWTEQSDDRRVPWRRVSSTRFRTGSVLTKALARKKMSRLCMPLLTCSISTTYLSSMHCGCSCSPSVSLARPKRLIGICSSLPNVT